MHTGKEEIGRLFIIGDVSLSGRFSLVPLERGYRGKLAWFDPTELELLASADDIVAVFGGPRG